MPQGSILGPLLFNIYINDIIQVSDFKIKLFADDACLVYSCGDAKELQTKVNLELNKINHWRKTNKLSVNFNKSNYVIFNNKKCTFKYQIKMENNMLERTEDVKYLGVIVDQRLRWHKQINHINKKISNVSYIISKIRHYVDLDALKTVYYSLIHPRLSYCLTAWGGAPKSAIRPLILFQKKVLRIMTFSDFQHPSAELFSKLAILPIDKLYNLNISVLMYKTHNKLITGKYNLTQVNEIHGYNTRSAKNIDYKSFLEIF